MKKTYIIFIIVLLLFVTACSGNEKDSFTYIVKDNEITIVKYQGDETKVVIPEKINNKPVTKIGDRAFEGCYDVTVIRMPDSIKSIGLFAFDDTKWYKNIQNDFVIVKDGILIKINQKSGRKDFVVIKDRVPIKFNQEGEYIVIPEGVTSLTSCFCEYDGWALMDKGITKTYINFPGTLKKIDDFAFFNAKGNFGTMDLKNVEIIGKSAFEDSTVIKFDISPNIKFIDDRAFAVTDTNRLRDFTIFMSDDTADGYFLGEGEKVFLPFGAVLGEDVFYGLGIDTDTVHLTGKTFELTKELLKNMQSYTSFHIPSQVSSIEKGCLPDNCVIFGESGSYAQIYAHENGLSFIQSTD